MWSVRIGAWWPRRRPSRWGGEVGGREKTLISPVERPRRRCVRVWWEVVTVAGVVREREGGVQCVKGKEKAGRDMLYMWES